MHVNVQPIKFKDDALKFAGLNSCFFGSFVVSSMTQKLPGYIKQQNTCPKRFEVWSGWLACRKAAMTTAFPWISRKQGIPVKVHIQSQSFFRNHYDIICNKSSQTTLFHNIMIQLSNQTFQETYMWYHKCIQKCILDTLRFHILPFYGIKLVTGHAEKKREDKIGQKGTISIPLSMHYDTNFGISFFCNPSHFFHGYIRYHMVS